MLIRMSDRARFCYREVVAAGALQAITVDLRVLPNTVRRWRKSRATRKNNSNKNRDHKGIRECILLVSRLLIFLLYYEGPSNP